MSRVAKAENSRSKSAGVARRLWRRLISARGGAGGFQGYDNRRQQLFVAGLSRHGFLHAAAANRQQWRRHPDRLVFQPQQCRGAGKADHQYIGSGFARGWRQGRGIAAGQPKRGVGQRTGQGRNHPEAGTDYPDQGARFAARCFGEITD